MVAFIRRNPILTGGTLVLVLFLAFIARMEVSPVGDPGRVSVETPDAGR